MKIYTYPRSRSLRVIWTLEELNLQYTTEGVDLMSATPGSYSPHPQHKVPVLDDDGFILFETSAICKYLCSSVPSQDLYPSGLTEQAIVEQWMSFAITDLESPVWALLKHQALLPEALKVKEVVAVAKGEALRAIECIDRQNLTKWITGEKFTLADIFVAHNLLWAKACGLRLSEQIEAYLLRCQKRQAYRRALLRNNA